MAADLSPTSFHDWDYAVWAWSNLKTGEAYDAEWAKHRTATLNWEKLKKINPKKAARELKSSPDADSIKKGLDLGKSYKWWSEQYGLMRDTFWQVYEPGCYEGQPTATRIWRYNAAGHRTGYSYAQDDSWAKMNVFTGKCDYPDWRTTSDKEIDERKRSIYMQLVDRRIKRMK